MELAHECLVNVVLLDSLELYLPNCGQVADKYDLDITIEKINAASGMMNGSAAR